MTKSNFQGLILFGIAASALGLSAVVRPELPLN